MVIKVFLPEFIFKILEDNPNLSISEIMKIANVAYSTAARYKKKYDWYKSNTEGCEIHHNVYLPAVENYRLYNKQQEYLNMIVFDLLNNGGFDSTQTLMRLFYKKYPKYKYQSKRNFNRYFKNTREFLIRENIQYPLRIQKSIQRIGFCTEENPVFNPTD
ncbi:hypothetical protein HX005_16005 [Acinetobacter sp. R933-2]|uniref:hypothetical protein n=1 Tax=Acinetobacter sp. R933-2 TaxID=2746728 RepID=UPI002577E4E6|nr:hypothetical protein [Acinetobacter sp. R933-2]MDM1248892.1 hypothetical protein [Acinetobacter sp. R933-2]